VILSSVSLAFMADRHLDLISLSVCLFSLITLSHRRTHSMWADSVVMICMRRVAPFELRTRLSRLACCSLWEAISLGEVIVPLPSIRPRLISGHS